ncbi:MAG: universal stress protein [Cellvibrionaceae bacterium]
MIQKIILATDMGPFASHALEHALDLAASHRAKVVVVHAVEPLSGFAQAMVATYLDDPVEACSQDNPGAVLDSIRSQIAQSFAHERSEIDPVYDCFSEFSVVQGRPAEVILSEATRTGADLIIMGSHGPESMGNNVLGSVTARVLQLSKVPVYMVPMISPRNWYRLTSDASPICSDG